MLVIIVFRRIYATTDRKPVSPRQTPIAEGYARLHWRIIAAFLEGKGEARADFIDGMAVRRGVAKSRIKREVFIDLPDGAKQYGFGFGERPYLVVKYFGYGAYLPGKWSFQNHPCERFGMLVAGEIE